MATIKSYTDLSQSKKLAEILSIESADMWLNIELDDDNEIDGYTPSFYPEPLSDSDIPCWSLAALLSVIPIMIGSIFEKDALRLRIDKSETNFNIWYDNIDTGMVEEGLDIIETNPIDACVEMILKLKKNNLL